MTRALLMFLRWASYQIGFGLRLGWNDAEVKMRGTMTGVKLPGWKP